MVHRVLVLALMVMLSGAAMADDARRLRAEAATLVQAAENADDAQKRRALLEEALGKLLEIQERYPSASAQIRLFLGGKRISLSPDDVHLWLQKARLAEPGFERLRKVLGRELSPTAVDENGWTDLHFAAALNLPELVEVLLDAGADVAVRLKEDGHPLSDRLKRSLDDLGLFSDFARKGYQPLHIASFNGAAKAEAMLVARGADIRTKDNEDRTPPDSVNDDVRRDSEALSKSQRDVPKTRSVEPEAADPREVLERKPSRPSPTAMDENGWNDLHFAAALDLPEAAGVLLDFGVDVAAKLRDDELPLSERLKRSLSALGLFSDFARKGYQPLHIASFNDAAKVAVALIEKGADVHAQNSDGWMPLHFAAENNAAEVASVLIEGGADIHAKTNDGWLPLQIAAENSARKVVAVLLESGADCRSLDSNRQLQWCP